MGKKYYKSRYFKRILLMILLSGIIPALILGVFLLRLTSIYSDYHYKMHQSIVVNQKKRVEDTLKATEYSMIQFLSLPEIAQIIRTPREAEYFQDFNTISKNLYQLQSPMLDIDDTILVSIEKEWVLSKFSLTNIASSSYKQLIEKFYKNNNTSFWYYDDDSIYLVKKLPLNAKISNGLLAVKIKKSAVQNITAERDNYFPVTIIDEDATGIVGTGDNFEIAKYYKTLAEYDNEQISDGIVNFIFLNENYTLTSSKSDYNGWIYLSIDLTSELNENINQLYFGNVVLTFLVFIGIFILSLRFSLNLYQPIDNLNQAMNKEILATGEGTMDISLEENPYNKLRYILFSISELRKALLSHKKTEVDIFLKKLYTGDYTKLNEQDFIEKGIFTGTFCESYMHVIGIKYAYISDEKEDSDLYLFALKNIIEETFLEHEFFKPVCVNEIVYITYVKKASSETLIRIYLKNMFETLSHIVERYLHKKIYIGISKCFYSLDDIVNAIDECNMSLRICVQKNNYIEFFNDDKDKNFYPNTNLNLRRMKIIQSVLNGDSEAGKIELDEYFIEIRQINYYLFKLEINNLLSDILDCTNSSFINVNYSIVGEITNFDITSSLNSVEDLKKCIWDNFLLPLYKKAVEPPETETAETLHKIIEYLNHNIGNNITLEQCATHFHYNPNYMSKMFKNYFGKTFTDYMIDQKVMMAKNLLLTTDISINEISERLGYNNSQNFIRVFKKNVLMTPGQFRNNKKKSKEV